MKSLIKFLLKKLYLLNIASRIMYRFKINGYINGLKYFFTEDIYWIIKNYFFDKKLGIETYKSIETQELDISEFNKKYANRYQPVSIKHLKISMDLLLKNNNYDIFLDLGCGKGKPVFYSQRYYPKIKEFIGIDISRQLIEIANLNLSKIEQKISSKIKTKFEVNDILKYKFKENKRYLIFMFNPFNREYFLKFFSINKNLFLKSNYSFIIVNSPCDKISYLNLIYQDKEIALEIYGQEKTVKK